MKWNGKGFEDVKFEVCMVDEGYEINVGNINI
jgi:hypothetical protein